MPIAKLSIDLEARLANLQAGLDKAGVLAARSAKQMEDAFNGVKSVLGGLGAGIASALSVSGLVAIFKATNDGLLKIKDLAEATGASIENISGLEDVARRAGGSIDDVSGILVKFNSALKDTEKTQELDATFKALGLSAEELKRADPAQALLQTAIALDKFADDGNKARLVQELFGKSIREALPYLHELAEAGELNGKVRREQVLEADKFNKELARLETAAQDAARSLAGPLVSAMNETIAKFREGAKEGKSFYRVIFEEQLKLLGLLKQAPPNLNSQAGAGRGFVNPELVKPSLPSSLGATTIKPGRLPAAPKVAELFVGPQESEALKDALKAIQQTDVVKIQALKNSLQELFSIRAAGGGDTAAIDEAIGNLVEQLEKLDPATKLAADSKARLDALLEATPTAQLEKAREDMQFLAEAFEAGKISAEQFSEAASTRLGIVADAAKQAADEWTVFADQAARNIQTSLGDTLLSVMEGNFRAIGDSWKRALDRMVAEALAAKLGKALLGDFGSTGEIGGLAGDAFKFLGGLFGGGRASGGPVRAGTTYLVGERGPELLRMGSQGGSITPNAAGVVVHQVININTQGGEMDRRSRLQLQAEIGLATQRAIARNT